jgi:galactoside O-acetyltransferase
MGRLSRAEIDRLRFAAVGSDVAISDKASFYNCSNIRIGNHVRIDDFCVLSAGLGGIVLGDHIHLAVYTSLIGAGRIVLADFCNISSRVSIYSSSDDYSGGSMTNPTVPAEFTDVVHADVTLRKHVIVGAGSVILPGIELEEGVAIGALSLVNRSCTSFGIYAGVPAVRMKERKRDLLQAEAEFRARPLTR